MSFCNRLSPSRELYSLGIDREFVNVLCVCVFFGFFVQSFENKLKSILGSIQFYHKFIPDLSSVAEPLYSLTRKDITRFWGPNQEKSFNILKELLLKRVHPASTDRRGPCGLKTGCPVCPVQRVMAGQNVGIGTRPIGERSSLMCQRAHKGHVRSPVAYPRRKIMCICVCVHVCV